jgi:hypothetical protein
VTAGLQKWVIGGDSVELITGEEFSLLVHFVQESNAVFSLSS